MADVVALAGLIPGDAGRAVPIGEVGTGGHRPEPTGIDELDRVLGGGLVAGSATLLGGRAGHRQVHHAAPAGRGRRPPAAPCSTCRPRRAASRCGSGPSASGRCPSTCCSRAGPSLPDILAHVAEVEPGAARRRLHPDRLRPQRCSAPGLGGPGARVRPPTRPGGQAARRCATVLVGHVTKDGDLAGPARPRAHRRHRAVLRGRPPPRPAPAAGRQAPLRAHRRARRLRDGRGRAARAWPTPARCSWPTASRGRAGSAVVPAMEGPRPLLVEVQALVDPAEHRPPAPLGPGHRRPAASPGRGRARQQRLGV